MPETQGEEREGARRREGEGGLASVSGACDGSKYREGRSAKERP